MSSSAAFVLLLCRALQNDDVRLAAVRDPSSAWWWPWLLAVAGIGLVIAGLRWLAAHRPAPKARRVSLAEGSALTADAGAVADAAARVLRDDPGISKAGATATVLRGVPTVTLTASVPARRGLRAGLDALEAAAHVVRSMLGDAVAVRSVLHVDLKSGPVVR